MKSDSFELVMLFDCYSGMLTEKQRTCFDLYYNQDFSLSEIAEECGISRQGVYDTLSRTEASLMEMEDTLHLAKKELQLRSAVAKLLEIAEKLEDDQPDTAAGLRGVADALLKE